MVGSKKKEWRLAFKRSSPFLISATLSGIVFGALVIAGGLTVIDGLVMSGFIYSGAAQFVGLQLIVSHTSLAVALLTTLLLSLRFFLYSISLIDEVRSIPVAYRIMLAFGLIDAVFVMAKERFNEPGTQSEKNTYFMACVLIFYFNWIIGTAIGLFLGDTLAHYAAQYGLEFITYATFVAMLAPYLRVGRNIYVSLVALATYILTYQAPYNLAILISCVVAVVVVKVSEMIISQRKVRQRPSAEDAK
ncbi:Inner membrane protein YgaZ [Serratia marcescens]|nr:azaleucine resistance protein AzlC [Serratia marcescens]KMJ09562.1 azaleucine resistance protein AzlC [Serratia marcescens]CAE7323172.1 Inner membrane protein YgaZ [Serratia marcescens]CAE7323620.1 Inner membrane protein YgaZ [Serratia marcescens]CAH3797392.1 Inner membrane protein YgaZ [Serratia marcescens]